MAASFNEAQFRRQVSQAMKTVKQILSNTRAPELPSEIAHTYDDKYAVAEQLSNTAVAAIANVLEVIGFSGSVLAKLRQWSEAGHEVTLRFTNHEMIDFDREQTRDIESPKVTTTTTKDGYLGSSTKSKSTKVVTTVTEYCWKYTVDYRVLAFKGPSPDESSVQSVTKTGSREVITKAKKAPATVLSASAETGQRARIAERNVSITWLLKMLTPELELRFGIDRTAKGCHTPLRNPQVQELLSNLQALAAWGSACKSDIMKVQRVGSTQPQQLNNSELFVPVIPLVERKDAEHPPAYSKLKSGSAEKQTVRIGRLHAAEDQESSIVLQLGDIEAFLGEHRRGLAEMKLNAASRYGESGPGLHTGDEATLQTALIHFGDVATQFINGICSIEWMLEQQLCSAIGRDINPQSFRQFMQHHSSKLYGAQYAPQPFCYAVRRPNCYPEGSVSIECAGDPISTIVRHIPDAAAMRIRLSAQCAVELHGDRYLHAYLAQSFQGNMGSDGAFSLVARARQFSSFILMVGKLDSATSFRPDHAIIVKDKDDLKLPMILEALPSAKEFADAVESLSPEQQRFAKAYRAMQLEGTVFAVGFVQLKPQLERLLNLPSGALMKEIQLSQDLQELFIEHQIPSDLLSYDGDPDATPVDKLAAVKRHVASITDMIVAAKKSQIEEAQKKYQLEHPVPPPSLGGARRGSDDDESDRIYECIAAPTMNYASLSAAPLKKAKRKGFGVMRKSKTGGGGGGPPTPQAMRSAPMDMMDRIAIMEMATESSIELAEAGIKGGEAVVEKGIQASADSAQAADQLGTADDVDLTASAVDFTSFPALLDQRFLALDQDSALRPTKISVGGNYNLETRDGLLAKPRQITLGDAEQRTAKNKAFDLLDAISRSGALPIMECASLHIVVAVTHQFDKSIIDTVVRDNVNPIEKVERSSLIIAGAVHDRPVEVLVRPDQIGRITGIGHCKMLLARADSASTV